MTQQDNDKGRWPWGKILLALSLALNFGFVGLMIGAGLRHDGADRTGAFGTPYMRALPREERRAVLQGLRASEDAGIPDRKMRRAMFEDVLATLRSEPFDPAALRQAVTHQAEVSVAVQRRAQQAWLDVVIAMEVDDRRAYADAVEKALRRGSKRGPSDAR